LLNLHRVLVLGDLSWQTLHFCLALVILRHVRVLLYLDHCAVLLPASVTFVRLLLRLASLLSIDSKDCFCVLVVYPCLLSGRHDVEFVLDNEVDEFPPLLVVDEFVLAA
jgi:hypothetical protein